MDPFAMVREGLGWLHVLIALAGLGVCVVHASRSRWMWVLAGGFGGEAAVSASHRLVMLALGRGMIDAAQLGGVFLATTVVALAAWAAIVGGLAGVLAELARPRGEGAS